MKHFLKLKLWRFEILMNRLFVKFMLMDMKFVILLDRNLTLAS